MKTKHIATLIAITMLTAGTAFAQSGSARRGGGYGGPPKTEAERAERQKANGGICNNPGNRTGQGQMKNRGRSQGNGQGRSQRGGPRDGSGPRGGTAGCPAGT